MLRSSSTTPHRIYRLLNAGRSQKLYHFLWYWRENGEWDVTQAVEHPLVKVWIIWSILHSGCICSLGCFPLQPVVHNWAIKGCGICCPVCGKVRTKVPFLLIRNSSLCGKSRFPLKKYVTITLCLMSNSWCYENQCALDGQPSCYDRVTEESWSVFVGVINYSSW